MDGTVSALERALRAEPSNDDVRNHLVAKLAGIGRFVDARSVLLDPFLATRLAQMPIEHALPTTHGIIRTETDHYTIMGNTHTTERLHQLNLHGSMNDSPINFLINTHFFFRDDHTVGSSTTEYIAAIPLPHAIRSLDLTIGALQALRDLDPFMSTYLQTAPARASLDMQRNSVEKVWTANSATSSLETLYDRYIRLVEHMTKLPWPEQRR